jgi:hypothetical protein
MTPHAAAAGKAVKPRLANDDTFRLVGRLLLAAAATFVSAPAAHARALDPAPAAAQPDDDDDDSKDEAKEAALARVQPVFQEADFNRWIFQNNIDGKAGVRKRLESMMAVAIDDIDRACKLGAVQKERIELAGRGDIKRFEVLYEKVHQKFLKVRHDQQQVDDIWQELTPLQVMAQSGLFNEDSLLFRSLHNVLTAEQFALFDAVARERLAFRHQARIELVLAMFEMYAPFTESQRQGAIAGLAKLSQPPRRSSPYAYHVMMYQLSLLPNEKIRPLFDDVQWKAVRTRLDQFKGWKDWLKQAGQLPEEDEEVDTSAAKPAAKKG